MADSEDFTQRLLGDINPDPFEWPALTRGRPDWLERLREPVTWEWLLPILGMLVVVVLVLG